MVGELFQNSRKIFIQLQQLYLHSRKIFIQLQHLYSHSRKIFIQLQQLYSHSRKILIQGPNPKDLTCSQVTDQIQHGGSPKPSR